MRLKQTPLEAARKITGSLFRLPSRRSALVSCGRGRMMAGSGSTENDGGKWTELTSNLPATAPGQWIVRELNHPMWMRMWPTSRSTRIALVMIAP